MSYPNRASERRPRNLWHPREWIAVVGLIILTAMVTLFICSVTSKEHVTLIHYRSPT